MLVSCDATSRIKLDKMGDDLDQLLDEVERKFCGKVFVSAPTLPSDEERHKHEEEQRKTGDNEDLEAFIDKLLEEDFGAVTPVKRDVSSKNTASVKMPSCYSGGRRCCPVYLGGSSVQRGIGTTTSKRSCDQLRCTSCDFSVLTFDDCEWDHSCEYLFFRNHVPDRLKLQSRLHSSPGFRSYCCQCSWTSVSQLTELTLSCSSTTTTTALKTNTPLRWVCAGKHQE